MHIFSVIGVCVLFFLHRYRRSWLGVGTLKMVKRKYMANCQGIRKNPAVPEQDVVRGFPRVDIADLPTARADAPQTIYQDHDSVECIQSRVVAQYNVRIRSRTPGPGPGRIRYARELIVRQPMERGLRMGPGVAYLNPLPNSLAGITGFTGQRVGDTAFVLRTITSKTMGGRNGLCPGSIYVH
jgi:hypothetical protein